LSSPGVALAPVPRQLFLAPSTGEPAAGYKIYTYAAGTTTKTQTYTDATGQTPNLNPIILDSLGEADIWLLQDAAYKLVFAPATDTDPPTNAIWTRDNITVSGGTDALAVLGLATNVFNFIPFPLVQQIVAGTCSTDVTQYLNEATASAGPGGYVYFPAGTYPCGLVTYYANQTIAGSGPSSTTLSKTGVNSLYGKKILVPYNWLNDIAVATGGITIMNMGFQADLNSTAGAMVIDCGYRNRILNCSFAGDKTGISGGIHTTNYTTSGIIVHGNTAGTHVSNCLFVGLQLGALYALSTYITAIAPNVSITLNRATTGTGGTNTYNDTDANVLFTGTSNGTITILVPDTTGLSVNDAITGPDVITDNTTDLYFGPSNIVSFCGGVTTGAIDSANVSGWQVFNNKLESCPGPIFNCNKNCHSLMFANNFVQNDGNIPQVGMNNIAVNIIGDAGGQNVVVGNQFKSRTFSDPTQQITVVNFDVNHPNVPSQGNVCSDNSFDVPVGAANFTAFNVNNTDVCLGTAFGNSYYQSITPAQRGNGDAVWSPNYLPVTPPAAPPSGWVGPYVDVNDGKLTYLASTGTTWKSPAP
jgi:hypothetical protein